MVTKMAAKIGRKPEIGYFGANLRHLADQLNIEHKQIPKKDILSDDENYQGKQHL